MASLTSTKQVLVIEDEDGNDNKMDIVPIITSSEQQDTTMVTVTTTTASTTSVEVMPIPSAPRRVMDPNGVQGIRLSKNLWMCTYIFITKLQC